MLSRGEDIVPIPGTKRRSRLVENLGALDIKLTPAELSELEAVIPSGAVAGERYPPSMMSSINR